MKRWRLGASALAVLATVGVCVLFLPALRQTARPAAALSSHPIRWVLDLSLIHISEPTRP